MKSEIRSHGFTALGPLHEAFARLTGLKAAIVAILLGAFSAVAFAPFHFSPVLIISFTGLVWMLDGARGLRHWGRATFLRGWAFGAGYFLVSMHWTAAPFLIDPARHIWFIWMPLILLPAWHGAHLGCVHGDGGRVLVGVAVTRFHFCAVLHAR